MYLTWFWLHWLGEYESKSAEDGFTNLRRVTARHITEEGEIILKLFYWARLLARSWVLRKNQRELLSRQNLQSCFRLDLDTRFGRAPSKICSRSKGAHGIQVKDDFLEKTKSTLKHKKSCKNILNLILDTLFSGWRFTLSSSISNSFDCLQRPLGIEQKIYK